MPADTFTSTLGTLVMQTGNDNNTWGTNANSFVFQIFEDAIANVLTSTVTGGTLDLSGSPPPAAASQARYSRLRFTGVLTSNQTVIVPNLSKIWLVDNATSGAFSLLMKTPSGTATQIPQNTLKQVACNGSNVILRTDFNEIGQARDFFMPTVPGGFLETDGSAISRTGFPDLFAYLGTSYGTGDGFTTFNIPNTKDTGRYRRSRSGSTTVGAAQSSQNLSHTHTDNGAAVTNNTSIAHTHFVSGSTGNDSPDHTHNVPTFSNASGGGGNIAAANATVTNQFTTSLGASVRHQHSVNITSAGMSANDPHSHTFTFTTATSGGTEARPESIVVLSCIRY